MRFLLATALLLALAPTAPAQTDGLQQIDDETQRFLERQRTLGHLADGRLDVLPLSARDARALLDSLAARPDALTDTDRRLLAHLRGERPAGLLTRYAQALSPELYRNNRTLLSVRGDAQGVPFGFEADAVLNLAYGPVQVYDAAGRRPQRTAWLNTRGVRAAGHAGRFFFETRVEENQARAPEPRFVPQTAPRLGFTLFRDSTYDYFNSTGVIGYRGPVLEARFGRDRNRWGFARSSPYLSNYAAPYDHLQLRWTVWRLQFTNLYARFTNPVRPAGARGDDLYQQRFGAFHRLAIRLPAGLEAEVFEAIIFGADTTAFGRRASFFELAYLNPFQFYRGAERDIGSPDNALAGGGLAWQGLGGARLYGQLLLDELSFARLRDDWWGNKWAVVAGAEVSDPGLPGLGRLRGLDLRAEAARLRPYLYSHRGLGTAYVHFRDGLGHPAGPNAEDLTLSARYVPSPDMEAVLDLAFTRRGRNTATQNFGSDPLEPYTTRVSDDDVVMLQGVRQSNVLAEARLGYRLLPDATAGAAVLYVTRNDAELGRTRYAVPQVFLRWGVPFASTRY
ncbi:MAG: hypothetical protein ACK41D_10075 [Rubricoccaceae bacterium]